MKESNTNLNKKLQKVEEDGVNLQQYLRRNNIELHGIPDDVDDDELEDKMREIGEIIGVNIKHRDLEACHRLKKGNTMTHRLLE